MKKVVSFVLVLSLILSVTSISFAKPGNGNGYGQMKKMQLLEDNTSGSALTKAQIKEMIKERKRQAYDSYTEEELEDLQSAKKAINNRFKGAKVLDVDGVTINGHVIKFDSPPYITGGRTVIPVRAITQGLGASVSWDAETRVVTVEKDGIVIELPIGSNTAIVNGEEVVMDSKADITNSRTYVPIRFIVETFKLGINWDDENEIVEIEDEDAVEETTDSAIETEEDPEGTTDSAVETEEDPEGTTDSAVETEEDPEETTDSAVETEEDPEGTTDGAIETEEDSEGTTDGAIETEENSEGTTDGGVETDPEAAAVFDAPAEDDIEDMGTII